MLLSILDYIFARNFLYKFNIIILKLSLRFIGYNHHKSLKKSGELYFLKEFCKKKPKICIDVGANQGIYSKFLLDNSKTKVIAFEPLSLNFTKLKKLKNKYFNRLFLYNIGLSNKKKRSKIKFNNKNLHWANFDAEINQIDYLKKNTSSEICKLDKLDDIMKNNKNIKIKQIDLIKIDTEGHELEVLLGSLWTIKKYKPKYIQIEYNWHHLVKNVNLYYFSTILKNYNVFKIFPNDKKLIKIDPLKPEHNYFNFSNIVFIRK